MPAIRTARHPGPHPSTATLPPPVDRRTRGEKLLAEIEQFMRTHPEFSPTKFSRQAAGYGEFVQRLQGGVNPSDATCAKVRGFMAAWT